jgi:hypothetical protein
MKMQDIRKKARKLGVKTGRMKKADLIREIQTAEGNQSCFGRSGGVCDQVTCCFMNDCMTLS